MTVHASVVMITVGRDSLVRAVHSVFNQDLKGVIQVLIGVDAELFGPIGPALEQLARDAPANILLTPIHVGYSTSIRHGGVHSSRYGGSLRTALSFLAASEHVAYLDDDDWYEPAHIRLMLKAIQKKSWSFTLSNYADTNSSAILGTDTLESVGPDRGVYRERFGGFVRPSALMINKIKLSYLLHLWSISPSTSGDGEDRLIFNQLLKHPDYGETGVPTVNCTIDPRDSMHAVRMKSIRGESPDIGLKQQSIR